MWDIEVTVSGLGLAEGVAGLGGPGRADGVLGVALASPAAPLAVGAVDFDHADAVGVQVAGEASAVAAGALDADQLDFAEGLHAEQAAAMVRASETGS